MYRVFTLADLQWMLDEHVDSPTEAVRLGLEIAEGDGMMLHAVIPADGRDFPETLFVFRDRDDAPC